ncbi:hypothetical protein Micbo1qcDRAFT_205373 [Microdochium bolleyi]|uniref:Uncharacterized protein n=1 Tax=Microdochium bolleyi TaxID=196109 RepID=A0A136J0F1_9PEZI|nr:hypothetical protein Micbo1qcDRAFT_205373 [Microdochium bolleyi]
MSTAPTSCPAGPRSSPVDYFAFFWTFLFPWYVNSQASCLLSIQYDLFVNDGVQGNAFYLDGKWSVPTFIFNYDIIALATLIGGTWKIVKRTPFHRSVDVDLHSGLDFFGARTAHYRREREAKAIAAQDGIWGNSSNTANRLEAPRRVTNRPDGPVQPMAAKDVRSLRQYLARPYLSLKAIQDLIVLGLRSV